MVVTREPGSIARERPARMGTIFAVHPLVRAEGASTSALSANRILLKRLSFIQLLVKAMQVQVLQEVCGTRHPHSQCRGWVFPGGVFAETKSIAEDIPLD